MTDNEIMQLPLDVFLDIMFSLETQLIQGCDEAAKDYTRWQDARYRKVGNTEVKDCP